MSDMNELLTQRTKKNSVSKMAEMARQSTSGHLTSFSGVFSVEELSKTEKDKLEELLTLYSQENNDIATDLTELISLSCEVKAINNQAALLHGERIKKAHQLLIHYRDGAFTGWLIAMYGNRQTPYNFLQYYEFYHAISKPLRVRLEQMPRQAVYTLASRNGDLEKKQELVEAYKGETKSVLLEAIRKRFPLEEKDKRQTHPADKAITSLQSILQLLRSSRKSFSKAQKATFSELLQQLNDSI